MYSLLSTFTTRLKAASDLQYNSMHASTTHSVRRAVVEYWSIPLAIKYIRKTIVLNGDGGNSICRHFTINTNCICRHYIAQRSTPVIIADMNIKSTHQRSFLNSSADISYVSPWILCAPWWLRLCYVMYLNIWANICVPQLHMQVHALPSLNRTQPPYYVSCNSCYIRLSNHNLKGF